MEQYSNNNNGTVNINDTGSLSNKIDKDYLNEKKPKIWKDLTKMQSWTIEIQILTNSSSYLETINDNFKMLN